MIDKLTSDLPLCQDVDFRTVHCWPLQPEQYTAWAGPFQH